MDKLSTPSALPALDELGINFSSINRVNDSSIDWIGNVGQPNTKSGQRSFSALDYRTENTRQRGLQNNFRKSHNHSASNDSGSINDDEPADNRSQDPGKLLARQLQNFANSPEKGSKTAFPAVDRMPLANKAFARNSPMKFNSPLKPPSFKLQSRSINVTGTPYNSKLEQAKRLLYADAQNSESPRLRYAKSSPKLDQFGSVIGANSALRYESKPPNTSERRTSLRPQNIRSEQDPAVISVHTQRSRRTEGPAYSCNAAEDSDEKLCEAGLDINQRLQINSLREKLKAAADKESTGSRSAERPAANERSNSSLDAPVASSNTVYTDSVHRSTRTIQSGQNAVTSDQEQRKLRRPSASNTTPLRISSLRRSRRFSGASKVPVKSVAVQKQATEKSIMRVHQLQELLRQTSSNVLLLAHSQADRCAHTDKNHEERCVYRKALQRMQETAQFLAIEQVFQQQQYLQQQACA